MSPKVQIRDDNDEVLFERSLSEWDNIELTSYGAEEAMCRECGNDEFVHVADECIEFCQSCGEPHYY